MLKVLHPPYIADVVLRLFVVATSFYQHRPKAPKAPKAPKSSKSKKGKGKGKGKGASPEDGTLTITIGGLKSSLQVTSNTHHNVIAGLIYAWALVVLAIGAVVALKNKKSLDSLLIDGIPRRFGGAMDTEQVDEENEELLSYAGTGGFGHTNYGSENDLDNSIDEGDAMEYVVRDYGVIQAL